MAFPKVGRARAQAASGSVAPRETPGQAHYHCESCGADLRFSPGQTRLVCDHCGHVQDIPAATSRGSAELRELPLEEALRAGLGAAELEESRTLSCPNCGASIELDPGSRATQCPFCATPVVDGGGPQQRIRAQGVVPFSVTETEAREALGRWLKGRWFAPSGLAQYARRGRRMNGVYAPYWTFDAATQTRYQGQRGDYYYERRMVPVRTDDGRTEMREETVQRIRWTPVSGRVARDFDDVLIYAARSLPPAHVGALAPWDLSGLRSYQSDYLAGFTSESYSVELAEGHHLAQAEMLRVIQSDVRQDIGGDAQRIGAIDPSFRDETFKHVLLPIWAAAYRFRGQSYRFVVNGQTGRVSGDRPWSAVKIALAAGAALVAIVILVYLQQHMR